MSVQTSPPSTARPRRQLRPVHVVRTEALSPHLLRVVFGGDALAGFEIVSPTGHVKLFLPAPGETTLVLPTSGPQGLEYPPGIPRPTVRTYTPRRFDLARRELDVEFALHEGGAASAWAERARPGDPAGIAGPGRGYDPDPQATWFLIAGDESALPAIGMLLEALPRGAGARVLIEVPDVADALDPGAGPSLDLSWLPRAAGETPGSLLERAVGETVVPDGESRVWVAAEAGAIRRIRADLLGRRGLDPRRVVTRGYWKAGTANHPDHDYGEDG